MKYPSMSSSGGGSVTVPELSGGINTRDGVTNIGDNQLTDCRNVYWHNGLLCTRPGLKAGTSPQSTGTITKTQALNQRETILYNLTESEDNTEMKASLFDCDGNFRVIGEGTLPGTGLSIFATRAPKNRGADWYFFVSGRKVYKTENTTVLTEADLYVPTVTVNGTGKETPEEVTENDGTNFEGYNLLTDKCKFGFTTDGAGKWFVLPNQTYQAYCQCQIAMFNHWTGTATEYTVPLTVNQEQINNMHGWHAISPGELGLDQDIFGQATAGINFSYDTINHYLHVDATVNNQGAASVYAIPTVSSNNLLVTVATFNVDGDKICKATKAVWYGGERSGISGGTRLFVCGNPEEVGIIRWSDTNEPLYFPENNYNYVANDGQQVTNMASQSGSLVVFTEHSITQVDYISGRDFTYEDVLSGRINDVTTYTASFPTTPISSVIGCDCPDTLRLVNNKLVWADSEGYVWTLTSVNQYNERNVRDLSPMIREKIRENSKENLRKAVSAEYGGYYLLFVADKAYLMDADTSAYSSFQYYGRQQNAQKALPWYVWEFNDNIRAVAGDRESLYAVGTNGVLLELSGEKDYNPILDNDSDDIHGMFQTKMYDFGRRARKKYITQVYLGGTIRNGCTLDATHITDNGEYQEGYRPEGESENIIHGAGKVKNIRFSPNIHRITTYGIRCECNGSFAVTGIVINYKNQGVTR